MIGKLSYLLLFLTSGLLTCSRGNSFFPIVSQTTDCDDEKIISKCYFLFIFAKYIFNLYHKPCVLDEIWINILYNDWFFSLNLNVVF